MLNPSLKKRVQKNANAKKYVDVPSIDVQHLPLALTSSLVPTIEWWWYLGVQELLGIKEIIESANTINLRLIRGTDRPLARQARKGADMLTEMYRQTEPAKVMWNEAMTRLGILEAKVQNMEEGINPWDRKMRVLEIHARASGSRSTVDDVDRGVDSEPLRDRQLSTLATISATIANQVSIAMGLWKMFMGPNLRTQMLMLYELAP
ncbi:hypothetical protein FXO38_04267 [Capsicum annuum]|nr:hypothetical protein FXO38_04267 [Capsicum annuum]